MAFLMHKFPMQPGQFDLEMPIEAHIVDVQLQNDQLVMWAMVNDQLATKVSRTFKVIGTGDGFEEDQAASVQYIATVQMGPLVWHAFEILGS